MKASSMKMQPGGKENLSHDVWTMTWLLARICFDLHFFAWNDLAEGKVIPSESKQINVNQRKSKSAIKRHFPSIGQE